MVRQIRKGRAAAWTLALRRQVQTRAMHFMPKGVGLRTRADREALVGSPIDAFPAFGPQAASLSPSRFLTFAIKASASNGARTFASLSKKT